MDESVTRRRSARLPTWVRVSLVVGLILVGTLVSALLLSASGVGDRGRAMTRDRATAGQMHGNAPGHGGGGHGGGGEHAASGAGCP